MLNNSHNDLGWMYSIRWLREIKKSFLNNNKDLFMFLCRQRERNLFYLWRDKKAIEQFIELCQLGLIKFGGLK